MQKPGRVDLPKRRPRAIQIAMIGPSKASSEIGRNSIARRPSSYGSLHYALEQDQPKQAPSSRKDLSGLLRLCVELLARSAKLLNGGMISLNEVKPERPNFRRN